MRILGKGGKWNDIRLGPSIYEELLEHKRTRDHHSNFFFLNPSGKPLSRQSINNIIIKITKESGVQVNQKELKGKP